jgi:hypothetical protein
MPKLNLSDIKDNEFTFVWVADQGTDCGLYYKEDLVYQGDIYDPKSLFELFGIKIKAKSVDPIFMIGRKSFPKKISNIRWHYSYKR